MSDDCFTDSNVLLYTLDKDSNKQEVAIAIWRQGIALSTQVVMEFTNVCLKKKKLTKEKAFENALNLMAGVQVKSVTEKNSSHCLYYFKTIWL